MDVPKHIRSLQALVLWLASLYHEGKIYPMAERTGLSQALLDRYSKGMVRTPSMESLNRISTAYSLSLNDVVEVVYLRPMHAGPLRKLVAILALGAGILLPDISWASPPRPLDVEPNAAVLRLIGTRLVAWLRSIHYGQRLTTA